MCCLVPLQLLTTVGRLEVLLISTFVGLLSSMIEMTSHNGNDNFLLPFLTFLIIQYNFTETANALINISAVVSFTLVVTIIVAKLVGCLLPLLAKRLGFDPAVMASPFITTVVDAIGLIVYYFISANIFGLVV